MNLLSPIYKDGLAEEIDRICGSNSSVYSNYVKVVRINAAIDKYFALGNYQFEDSNKSDAPIEAIDLVDGTSRYSLGDLTSELLNFLRVEIINDDDNDELIYPNKLSNIIGAYDEYCSDDGTPAEYFKIGKYIDLKPAPDYDKTDGLKIYFDRPASKYTFVSCTIGSATPAGEPIVAAAHGLVEDDAIILETDGTLPTGFTADTIVYYVISTGLVAGQFLVSLTIGGSAVTASAPGSGNHKFLKVNQTPGVPTIHHSYIARYASLPFLIEKNLAQLGSVAQQIQIDENDIKQFFGHRNKDERKGLTMKRSNFR